MRETSLILIALVAPCAVLAQGDSTRIGSVSGVVYDSVARAPIAGALVQAVPAANLARDVRGVLTDAKGHYVIDSLAPGRYVVGFQAEALDTLALSPPLAVADIRAGERAKLDLAVPSSATIVAKLCGAQSIADSTGLLIGLLRDAKTDQAVDTGSVHVYWQELVIEKTARFQSAQRQVSGAVGRDGWFALCGVPANAEVAARAFRAADSTGLVSVTLPTSGFVRHDFVIGGTTALRGTVRTERGTPIANARVTIPGLERVALADSAGAFRFAELPAGSQTIDVRALGYAQVLLPVTLQAGQDTSVAFTLTEVKRVLDTMRVVAQRIYNRDSFGFFERKRIGHGYYFDQQWVEQRRPFDVSHMLYQVPSLHQIQRGFEKTWLMRGGPGGGYCTPSLFFNGMKMPPEMLGDIDLLAHPEEIEGIEVYRYTSMPAQFSDFRTQCGAIVMWTRPPKPKRGKG